MVQYRDSAPTVFAVVWAVQVMKLALGLAILALYFLERGPRIVRYNSGALVIAWSLSLAFVLFFVTPIPFAPMTQLYWEAAPFVVLFLLPWVCVGFRLALRTKRA